MSLNAKLFIALLVLMAFGCEQKSKNQQLKKRIPCSERKVVTETYTVWDSIPVVVKIIPTCGESFTVTYKQNDKTKKKQESGMYKVVIQLPNDTAVYPLTEVTDGSKNTFSDYSRNLLIDADGFDEADTSVIIYHELLLGKTKQALRMKVKFNSGFGVVDFEEGIFTESDDIKPIYDANAN